MLNEGKWLATASNDKTICLYIFGSIIPFATLKDHTNTVCALTEGINPNTLISGSWDQTARIWNNLDVNASSIELKGHDAAVWAVATLSSGKYATGSADKTIFIWNAKGEKLVVLKGHTDCIRGLVALADGSLLSCSNDATIRHWSDTYDCLKEFHGHSNYIYTIALNPALGDVFVTGSEDNTIRLWSISKGALGEALTLPVQSVWSVACSDQGDIVTGSSDGVVRIFSNSPTRIANPDILAAYDVSVQTRQTEQSKELGGVKVNDLPGPESLLQEGTEGQTRLVRQPNGKILCYQWTKGNWECLGDVMGASGGTKETSGKSLYEGKEYDFVFNVDIEDGAPPLKLPFNRTEDPWLAAQKFIHKNDLPQVYLEQVANFIITNANLTSLPSMNNEANFADPFTGEGRYIPTGNETAATPAVNVNFRAQETGAINSDPFTGGDSYSSVKAPIIQKHLPFTTITTFDVYDSTKILAKIKEFNQLNEIVMNDDALAGVVNLTDSPKADVMKLTTLDTMLKAWPEERLFPILDVVRLVLRNQETCKLMESSNNTRSFASILKNLTSSPPNQLMSSRAFCNLAAHDWGKKFVTMKIDEICAQLANVSQGNANLQIAIATFFLNQSILQKIPSNEVCTTLTIGAIKLLQWVSDSEATFRCYQAIGNLIVFNPSTVLSIVKSVDQLKTALEQNRNAQPEKLAEISAELAEKLL